MKANFAKIYEYACLITPGVKVIRIDDNEQHNDHLTKNYGLNLKQALSSGWIRYRDEDGLFDAWWSPGVPAQSLQKLIVLITDSNEPNYQFGVGRKLYDFDNKEAAIAFIQSELEKTQMPMAA